MTEVSGEIGGSQCHEKRFDGLIEGLEVKILQNPDDFPIGKLFSYAFLPAQFLDRGIIQ